MSRNNEREYSYHVLDIGEIIQSFMFRCDGTGRVFTDARGKFGDDSFYCYFAEGFCKR